MSELKRKIQERIVAPADHLSREHTIVGEVTLSDEKNNVCSVRYMDKDGYVSNKDNVPVRVYNQSFADWFPAKGEQVVMTESNYQVTIVSKYEGGYGTAVRAGTEMKKDIYTSMFGGTMAGNIF